MYYCIHVLELRHRRPSYNLIEVKSVCPYHDFILLLPSFDKPPRR
ncbi:MAG: hypothetical protein AB8V92_00640 [Coxiella endosymbiont of Dermacentor nuttalli]